MLNSTWRFVGRVLIIIILIATAYQKLHYPEMYKLDFIRSLTNIQSLSAKLGYSLPDLLQYTTLLIKLSGILDALVALLIFFRRRSGGYLAFFRLALGLAAYYLPWTAKNLTSYTQRERFANNIGLLGVALLLARGR